MQYSPDGHIMKERNNDIEKWRSITPKTSYKKLLDSKWIRIMFERVNIFPFLLAIARHIIESGNKQIEK